MYRSFYIHCAGGLAILVSGCASGTSQQLLPDGNTWDVRVVNLSKCTGHTSVDACVNSLEPVVSSQGERLCGKHPNRIFNCGKYQDASGGWIGVGCYVQCNEHSTIDIGNSSPLKVDTVSPPVDADVIRQAKYCQQKGGVWVNNGCMFPQE